MKKIKPVLHNLLFMYKQIYKISPMRIYMVFIMSLHYCQVSRQNSNTESENFIKRMVVKRAFIVLY